MGENLEKYQHITLEVTDYCNAKCKWCKTGRKNRYTGGGYSGDHKYLCPEDLKIGISYMIRHSLIKSDTCLFDLFNWGEPLLNPYICDLLSILSFYGMKIGLSTNASKYIEFPSEYLPNIEYLIFSVSGFSDETLLSSYLTDTMESKLLKECSKEILLGMFDNITKQNADFFVCPQKFNLVLDTNLNIIPCCLFNTNEKLGNLYDFDNLRDLKKTINQWKYCSRCISSKQAQIVTGSSLFPYENKMMFTTPKIYYGDLVENFDEFHTILCPAIKNGNDFELKISLPEKITYIRFDPLENMKSILFGLCFIYQEKELPIDYANGIDRGNHLIFEDLDPQIVIKLPNQESNIIIIRGKCVWY